MSVPVQDQVKWISLESAGRDAELKPRRGMSIPTTAGEMHSSPKLLAWLNQGIRLSLKYDGGIVISFLLVYFIVLSHRSGRCSCNLDIDLDLTQ